MSLETIYHFQSQIYYLLHNNQSIKQLVKGIYITVQHDAAHPFIFINLLETDNQSQHDKYGYLISFEVCVFSRDKTQKELLTIANHILKQLNSNACAISDYQIISLKDQKIIWERSQDLSTIKLAIQYKAFIRQR